MRISLVVNADSERQIEAALWGLLAVNLRMMTPAYPAVDSFARYQREPRGQETWQTADVLRSTRVGDCEDLAAYECAFLRVTGIDRRAKIGLKRSSVGWHVVVVLGDGRVSDPSARLGMYD